MSIVGGGFAVASLLVAGGSISAGVMIARSGGRSLRGVGWPVLLSGLTLILLVTPANTSGELTFRMSTLMLWSAFFVPLGFALLRHSQSTRPALSSTSSDTSSPT